MNYRSKLQEAYDAGYKKYLQEVYEERYRQSLHEAVDDAYVAYQRGDINEEQLNEIISKVITNAPGIVKGIGKGIKKGYDWVAKSFRRPVKPKGTPGASSLRNTIYGDGNKFKPMNPDLQKAIDDALGLVPNPPRPTYATPSQLRARRNIEDLRRWSDREITPDDLFDDLP